MSHPAFELQLGKIEVRSKLQWASRTVEAERHKLQAKS